MDEKCRLITRESRPYMRLTSAKYINLQSINLERTFNAWKYS